MTISVVFPETTHERVLRVEFVVARFPESEAMLFSAESIRPESEAIFPVAVARFAFVTLRLLFVMTRDPERDDIFHSVELTRPERVSTVVERVLKLVRSPATVPESEVRLEFVVARSPERERIFPSVARILPERVVTSEEIPETVLERVARIPERVAT